MVKIQIKDGTPHNNEILCRTCSYAHVIKGFSASHEVFYCDYSYPKHRLPFPVRACTHYEDKRLASRREMEEIAWFLTTRKSGRSVGFISAEKFHELELEAAEASSIKTESTEPTE
jgi:hypothetical protein